MKKILIYMMITLFVSIFMSGCATWHGLKKDTTQVWNVATS